MNKNSTLAKNWSWLPVIWAIGVVLELALTTPPRCYQMLPGRSVERVELISPNQGAWWYRLRSCNLKQNPLEKGEMSG